MTIGRVEPGGRFVPARLPHSRSSAAAMLVCVAAITGFRLLWLMLQPADLYPDEAQYWVWSQQLALGYFSKPPLVAWLIALTTGLFGDSEFAVRLSAPLLHASAAIFVYGIGALDSGLLSAMRAYPGCRFPLLSSRPMRRCSCFGLQHSTHLSGRATTA